MKLKKAVSALSALAITVSAFAGMAVTANAAEYTPIYERTVNFGDPNIWTDSSDWTLTGSGWNIDTPTLADDSADHHGLYINTNQTVSARKNFEVTAANALVKYEVDWYFGSSTARNNNYTYIQFGSDVRLSWGNYYNLYVSTDGGSTNSASVWRGSNKMYTYPIECIIDTATDTLVSLKFNGDELEEFSNTYLGDDATADSIEMGFIRGGSVNWTLPCGIKNITISQAPQDVIMSTYTINTAPYAKVEFSDGETYYSDYSGEVKRSEIQGTNSLTYTVTKGGYTSASGTATFDSDKSENVSLTTDYIYYEDFNTTNGDNWGMEGAPVVTTNEGFLKVAHPTGAGGQRHATKTFPASLTTDKNGIEIMFDMSYSSASDRAKLVTFIDSDGKRLVSVGTPKDDNNALYVFSGGDALTGNDEDGITPAQGAKICDVSANTPVTVTIKIDYVNNKVSAEANGSNGTVDLSTSNKNIAKLDVNPGRAQINMTIDNIKITDFEPEPITPPQPVAPEAVAATHSQDFTTNGDCASLWTATLTGVDGLTFNGIKVTAENSNGDKAENTASTTTITGESSIAVYIAVNLAKDTENSEGVTVTGVDAQLIDIQ